MRIVSCKVLFFLTGILLISFGKQLGAAPIIINPQNLIQKTGRVNAVSASFALNYYDGNTNLVRVDGGLMSRLVWNDHLFLAVSEGSYGKQDDEPYVNKIMGHLRYLVEFGDYFAIEGYGQSQYDEFRRLAMRALGGTGPRFSFHKLNFFEISIGTSYLYEYNRYDTGEYIDSGDEFEYHRWSSYLYLYLRLADNLFFNGTIYYQPRFDQFDDYRFFSSLSLDIQLKPFLSFFVQNNIVFDSKPPETVEQRDVVIKTGFKISFKGMPKAANEAN